MKLTLSSWLAAFAASLGLSGHTGMLQHDRNSLAGAAIGGIAGALLPDWSAARTLAGAGVGGMIGHLITPNTQVRGIEPDDGNGHKKGRRYGYNNRGRQDYGFNYSTGNGYNSGDRYHSTSNEWLGS